MFNLSGPSSHCLLSLPSVPHEGGLVRVQAVRWVLEMYAAGACVDWRFNYVASAPSTLELIKHLKGLLHGRAVGDLLLVPQTQSLVVGSYHNGLCD